jgi:hypothetical protein
LHNVEDRPGTAALAGPSDFQIHALDCFLFQDQPAELYRIDRQRGPV